MINVREATPTEILVSKQVALRWDHRVGFRHFVRELPDYRTENGVRHKQHGRSLLQVIDGVPHVRHHGEVVPLTATYGELDSGRTILFDLRLKSDYLPSLCF